MAIASWHLIENNRVPYVTADEVRGSATASGIDFSNLVENASAGVQEQALQALIVTASTKADNYVYGALGTMCATLETETGRYTANRQGQIIVQPYQWPIMEVRNFAIGYGPGVGMNTVAVTNNNCFIERYEFIMTPVYSTALTIGTLNNTVGSSWSGGVKQFVEYTYVSGFANTFSNGSIAKGSTSFVVDSSIGIYAGSSMTIWDGMRNEVITVSSSYDGSSLTIPIASPTKYAHGDNVNVSALPATVKQAVIHFVVAMVKQRGQGGLVINEIGEPMATSSSTVTSQVDEALGLELLDDFRQIWGRA